MSAAKPTTDHDFIRRWTEERNGVPSTVKSTHKPDEVGVLRIDFKGEDDSDDQNLEEISWDEFFEKFDEAGLAFLCQEQTKDGSPSRFFKLVKRDAEESGDKGTTRRAAAKGTASKGEPKRAAPKRATASKAEAKPAAAKSATASKAKGATASKAKSAAPSKTATKSKGAGTAKAASSRKKGESASAG